MPTANDDSTVSAPNSIDHDHRKAVELQQFQGIWSLEFIQTMSWPKPKGKGPDNSGQGSEQQWAIKGNEITWINPRDEEVKLTFTIDPTQSPKHFDVKFVSGPFRGKESQGIYERGGVSGKLLRLCLKDPLLATARPTKFGMDSISRHTLIGLSPATPTPDDAATDEQITAVEGVMALEVGDQVKHQQHPGGPQEPNRQPPQNPDAQRKQEVSTGVLSGRIVYDGEPPVAEDLYPSFAELTIDKPQQRGPDGRHSGVEAIYREYLKHNLRPTTIDPSLRVGKDKGLADVVIWVKSKDIPWSPPPEGQSPVTVQIKDASFVPRAIAVTVGQPLIVENQDPVNQNVSGMFYRTSNPAFNSLLKAGSPNSSRRMTFKSPEPIPNRISLDHCPWASGLVFVHSNPYVAISQEDGSFRIPNLPLGEWEFQAWHPRSGYISDWPGLRGPRRKGGVFTQKITPGENRLRAIKLQPEQFNTRN